MFGINDIIVYMSFVRLVKSKFLGLGILTVISAVNLLTASDFGLTWDFPHHLKIGLLALGEASIHPFVSYPYGFFTDVAPVVLSRFFPQTFWPGSFFVLPIVSGMLGIAIFYMFLWRYYGWGVALASSLILSSIPRFIAHIHVNMKDTGSTSFFLLSLFLFVWYMDLRQWRFLIISLIAFVIAVNTKVTSYQFIPVFVITALVCFLVDKSYRKNRTFIFSVFLFLVLLVLVPGIIWFLLWPHRQFSIMSSLEQMKSLVYPYAARDPWYALRAYVTLTPLPIAGFSFLGIPIAMWNFYKRKNILSFVFPLLFVYTLFKYPIFGFPVLDDVRYFLDIYFASSLLSVLAVFFLFRRHAYLVFIFIIGFSVWRVWELHPYEMTYMNVLSQNPDRDFWAASYREVFEYVNKTVPRNATVSARLAPELAYYLIRSDLKRNLLDNRSPWESDFVVILNRPSFFRLFRVENFYERMTPTKVFRTRTGVPLSYFYDLRDRKN